MKSSFTYFPLCFIILSFLVNNCSNPRNRTGINEPSQKANNKEVTLIDSDAHLENEVISQIFQAAIDSIKIKNRIIYVLDTLKDFGYYSGMNVDSIDLEEKSNTPLNQINQKLKLGKELRFVSSAKEYTNLTYQDKEKQVIMFFSRAHFNQNHDVCVLTIGISAQINTGVTYALYIKKKNNYWILDRIQLAGIR